MYALEKQLAAYLRKGDYVTLDAAGARERCHWVQHHFAEQYIAEHKMEDGDRYEVSQAVPIMKSGEGTVLGWGIKIKGDNAVIGERNYPHLEHEMDCIISEGLVFEYFTVDKATKMALKRRRASTKEQRRGQLAGARNVDDLV